MEISTFVHKLTDCYVDICITIIELDIANRNNIINKISILKLTIPDNLVKAFIPLDKKFLNE